MDFTSVSIIIAVAAAFGLLAKILKQPIIVGYLLAGFILAATGLMGESEALSSFGKIGVTLLLFLLGLEMDIRQFPSLGKIALLTGIGQIVFTSLLGFILAGLLGFGAITSIYIAISLTFSSTIIIVKLLSEKQDLDSLYGKISISFLLVQDFVAVGILLALSSLGKGGFAGEEALILLIKAGILIFIVSILSKKIIPGIIEKTIASSSELLFISSIAWALGFASLVAGPFGLTLEIGGFLAGISLSTLPEHIQIASKTRPLRDFFLTIFFLLLGKELLVSEPILPLLLNASAFSLFVLLGNPLIVMIIMGLMGYRKKTSFLAGLTVAQISEFSFILMSVGLGFSHVTEADVATVVIVGIITMVTSTYLILGADKIYKKVENMLSIFEKRFPNEKEFIKQSENKNHIVIIGCDKTGSRLVKYLTSKKIKFNVIDYDPKVFSRLLSDGVEVIFGDIVDEEIIKAANISEASLVISTINNLNDNLAFLDTIKSFPKKPFTIFTAMGKKEGKKLYENAADYAVVPDFVAADFIKHLIAIYLKKKSKFKNLARLNKKNF